jgi:hypothetical protein
MAKYLQAHSSQILECDFICPKEGRSAGTLIDQQLINSLGSKPVVKFAKKVSDKVVTG